MDEIFTGHSKIKKEFFGIKVVNTNNLANKHYDLIVQETFQVLKNYV